MPFTIAGILAPTGTPVDQTVHISLQGMEAIHIGWQNGVRVPGRGVSQDDQRLRQLQPREITAFMMGLETRMAVFNMQRAINEYRGEPLSAILPGVALAEMWQMMSMVENILALISVLVLLASLLGLSTMLLSSMRERQREIALFRAVGAHASSILFLVEIEALLITALGIALGVMMVTAGLVLSQEWLSQTYGLVISVVPVNQRIGGFMLIVMAAAAVLALVPSISAYRSSLSLRLQGR